jgi:hypothetical protein
VPATNLIPNVTGASANLRRLLFFVVLMVVMWFLRERLGAKSNEAFEIEGGVTERLGSKTGEAFR